MKANIAAELRGLRAIFSQLLHGPVEEANIALSHIMRLLSGEFVQDVCETILELDGVMPLIRVLDDPGASNGVLVSCLSILRKLATHGENASYTLGEKGLIPPLMALLSSTHQDVLAAAAYLAASLGNTEDTAVLLLDAGVVPAAKRLAGGLPVVRGGVAQLFAALTEAPGNRATIVAQGVLKELLDIINPRRLPNNGEPYDSDEEEEASPMTLDAGSRPGLPRRRNSIKVPCIGPDGNPSFRRRRSSLAPPPPPKPIVEDGKLAALQALSRLCSQGDFRDELQMVPNLFELLFELCDHADDRIVQIAHDIASHWEDERFGFCWNICCACKQLAQRLMLPGGDTAPAQGKKSPPLGRGSMGSKDAADVENMASAEGEASRSDYGEELTTLQRRLQEFMKDADVELQGLTKWQERLEEKLALAEQHRKAHASRCGRGPQRSEARRRHADAARDMEKMARELRLVLEEIRLTSHKLLRHGNVLLDAEEQVQLQITRLNELRSYVSAGKAVEVMSRWSKHSDRLCRDALITLATRLEMHVRSSIGERLASAMHAATAGALVDELNGLVKESDELLYSYDNLPSPAAMTQDLQTQMSLRQSEGSPSSPVKAPARIARSIGFGVTSTLEAAPFGPVVEHSFAGVPHTFPSPLHPDKRLSHWISRGLSHAAARVQAAEDLFASSRTRLPVGRSSIHARGLARSPSALLETVTSSTLVGGQISAVTNGSLRSSTSLSSLGTCTMRSLSSKSAVSSSPSQLGVRGLQDTNSSKFLLVKPHLISQERGSEALADDDMQAAAEALSPEGITALAADIRQGKLKMSRMRAIFNAIDSDRSGTVDTPEVESLLASLGIDLPEKELHLLVEELDIDGNGTLDFVELLELFRKISARAREAMREKMEVGVGVRVFGGPLLASMLADARKPIQKTPHCAQLQLERRLARARSHSSRRKTIAPLIRDVTSGGADRSILLPQKRDGRSAVHVRRSALSEAMGAGEVYDTALILHAFTELAKVEDEDEMSTIAVETLQRMYAWARISSVTDAGQFDGRIEHVRPHIDGHAWLRVLGRWLAYMKLAPPDTLHGGKVSIRGVRRCHPAQRQPALSGWETLRLLELFGVPSLKDIPYPEEMLLTTLPLSQMWPSVAPATAMVVPRGRGMRRMGSMVSSATSVVGD